MQPRIPNCSKTVHHDFDARHSRRPTFAETINHRKTQNTTAPPRKDALSHQHDATIFYRQELANHYAIETYTESQWKTRGSRRVLRLALNGPDLRERSRFSYCLLQTCCTLYFQLHGASSSVSLRVLWPKERLASKACLIVFLKFCNQPPPPPQF